jgi:acetyltransferase-like isoleucine patch superfamily enzyme
MEMIKMLLSICIPTKNRAKILFQSLESLVAQPIFMNTDKIEIVISDNASTDNTQEIVEYFIKRYPNKIKFFKNIIDCEDQNFEIVLSHGSGELLKLANDSLNWLPGSLDMMVRVIEETIDLKPPVFFLNQSRILDKSIKTFKGVEQLLGLCSYYITWIGGFSIWRSNLKLIKNFSINYESKLIQTDILLNIVNESNIGVVSNFKFANIISVGRKGGYNIAQVFGGNYLRILSKYKHCISEKNFSEIKKDVLENHILPFYFSDDHDFRNIDIVANLPEYIEEPYFKKMLLDFHDKFENKKFQDRLKMGPSLWRKKNNHNETEIRNLFDFDRVTVGKCTYGVLNVYQWGNEDEFLEIGHYVSIADNVTFLTGGNHEYRGITTFPVKVKLLGHSREALTNGKIKVGDDVWIGHNALILSGVQIGQGAIIAAGSVVAKDIPPYSIVGGNPAKIIKYRFPEFIIKEMLKINYEKINPEHLAELGESLYENCDSPVFHDSLSKLIEISKN